MKQLIGVALCLAVWLCCVPVAWGAEEGDALQELNRALPYEAREILGDFDPLEGGWETGMAALVEKGREEAGRLLRRALGSGAALLLIVLLCDGAKLLYFREKDSRLLQCVTLTGALAVVLLSAGGISEMIGLGAETIHMMNDFSKTLLPLLSAACAASGSVTAAAVREVGTTLFADVLVTCINQLLLPLVYIYIGAITANAVLHEHSLQKIAQCIKKGITWMLTILLTVFTAYLTISGAVSGTADAATILVGAAVLKNAIGVFGTLAVFALCLTPFLQIGVQYLMYKAAAFLAEVVDQTGLSGLIGEIGGAFGMVLGMTGACALLLIISLITSVSAVMPV